MAVTIKVGKKAFFFNFRGLIKEGYLKVMQYSFSKKDAAQNNDGENKSAEKTQNDLEVMEKLKNLEKNSQLEIVSMNVKEGETTPPKRYNSGSMILAMENAGQLIEDENLRAQIKGSGIGTSATRAEILKKLVTIKYLSLNKKTQVITPTKLGENIFDVVEASIKPFLNTELTAS